MREVADAVKERGARPGIWVRYLRDEHSPILDGWKIDRPGEYIALDPSVPEVLTYVARETKKIVGWGYELIKHDFSTFDLFGHYGWDMQGAMADDGWSFHDRTKTSAEIVLAFYRTIRQAAGPDCLILGCDCLPHLAAGLVHLNRTGADTSGRDFCTTRRNGVNTLAFRLPQNGAFYMVDADCVGVIPGEIDWTLNHQWLTLLSRSGTAVFLSCERGSLTPSQFAPAKEAYTHASRPGNFLVPLDWEYNSTPALYRAGKETLSFHWYEPDGGRFHLR